MLLVKLLLEALVIYILFLLRTLPDFGMLAKVSMNARSKERQAATNAKKGVINAGIAAEARVRQAQIKTDTSEEISDLKTSMKRKAGIVGALGAVAGGGLMAF